MGGRDLLIGDVFANAAVAVPDRVAVVHREEQLTFGELDRAAERLAGALAARGVGRGDRLVTWCPTTMALVPLFAAAAKLGTVFAPVNAVLEGAEAHPVIAAARPALVVTDDDRRRAAEGQAAAHGLGVEAVTLDQLAAEPGVPWVAPVLDEDAPHVIFFTSGSSGRPKGVQLSHRVSYLRTHPGALLERRGAMVCPYPLFHMAAWTIALQQWQARDAVVLLDAADAASICAAVARHRATRLNCVPAVWRRILTHLEQPGADATALHSLRFADTGTSATPVELLRAIGAACPQADIRVFYGSTEAGGVAALEPADLERKPGSCGVPAPSAEVRLDEAGELWVRGPLLFDGYVDDPGATAEAMVDGWFRTGDLAERDDEGYLTITGRAREVVRTGGESVAPAEVEAVLAGLPGVADVAVVGLPDPDWGEVVCAVVVPEPGTGPPTVETVRAFCAGRLAPFKQPRRVEVVDDIPRTASTQQVQRRLLVERLG